MLAQYVSNDEKTLHYIEHIFYRLEKTKTAFQQYRPINSKLCQPTFNYPKFYAISHLIQYIWDYNSAVNYDTVHNEVAHKYLLKVFYNKTNKKEYELLIWQYNMWYTNKIIMKNIIILEKVRKKSCQKILRI